MTCVMNPAVMHSMLTHQWITAVMVALTSSVSMSASSSLPWQSEPPATPPICEAGSAVCSVLGSVPPSTRTTSSQTVLNRRAAAATADRSLASPLEETPCWAASGRHRSNALNKQTARCAPPACCMIRHMPCELRSHVAARYVRPADTLGSSHIRDEQPAQETASCLHCCDPAQAV